MPVNPETTVKTNMTNRTIWLCAMTLLLLATSIVIVSTTLANTRRSHFIEKEQQVGAIVRLACHRKAHGPASVPAEEATYRDNYKACIQAQ